MKYIIVVVSAARYEIWQQSEWVDQSNMYTSKVATCDDSISAKKILRALNEAKK